MFVEGKDMEIEGESMWTFIDWNLGSCTFKMGEIGK